MRSYYDIEIQQTNSAIAGGYNGNAVELPKPRKYRLGTDSRCGRNHACRATLTTNKYDIDNDGDNDEVYEIGTPEELYWFAGLVNGTLENVTQNTSANAVLTADITVNSGVLKADGSLADDISGFVSWTPIGSDLKSYTGTFD